MTQSTEAAAPASGSYLARHWRGQFSLAKSWWLNGVLIFAIGIHVATIVVLMVVVTPLNETPILVYVIGLVALAVQVAGYVWALGGIWRSAYRHTGPKVWKYLAYVGSSLGLILSAGNFLQTLQTIFSV